MGIINSGLFQLTNSTVTSFSEVSTALANAILDFEVLRANGLGSASRFWTVTRYSTNQTILSVPGGMQFIGVTSAASPGALTFTLQNSATAGAISAGEAMYFADESLNADSYPITINTAGTDKIYGHGLSTAGATSITINKRGGSALLIYITTGTYYLLIDNTKEKNLLSVTTGIDLKTIATTNLYTVPTGFTCLPDSAILIPTTVTAFVAVGAAGIGVAAGEDDIFASVTLTGLDTVSEFWKFSNTGLHRTVPAASIIKLGVDTGFNATTFTGSVYLFGRLI